jgi:hypothetical protein
MADVFSKNKRSEVMSRIRSRGNKDTELALATLFRQHKITGWRRQVQVVTSTLNTSSGLRPPFPDAEEESQTGSKSSPGFYFPQAAARGVCGRLFLAWLSQARNAAEEQPGILAAQVFRK